MALMLYLELQLSETVRALLKLLSIQLMHFEIGADYSQVKIPLKLFQLQC